MIIGIAGGLAMGGMIMGAVSGSLLLMLGMCGAGMLIAGINAITASWRDKAAVNNKLAQYPSYRY